MVGQKIKCIKSCDSLTNDKAFIKDEIYLIIDKIVSNISNYQKSTDEYQSTESSYSRYVVVHEATKKLLTLNIAKYINNFILI